MDAPEQRKRYVERHEALKTARNSYDAKLRDIAENMSPRRTRFFQSEAANAGQRKDQKIINNTPLRAVRTLSAGMQAGITSPIRPWGRTTTVDPDLAERGSIRQWCDIADRRVLSLFFKANFYNATHTFYGDIGPFGTGVVLLDGDPITLLRARPIPVGEYCLAANSRGIIDTLYRETTLTVGQLVEKFGLKKCSKRVQDLKQQGKVDEPIEIKHIIEPRQVYDPSKRDAKNKPIASCWMECHADAETGFLLESGYSENPILGARWNTTSSNDVYGSGPGDDALGDCRALQVLERDKAQATVLTVRPPMVGPTALQLLGVSLLPDAMNYVDQIAGNQVGPLKTVNPAAIPAIEASIREHEERIEAAFFADLWLMLANSGDPQKTAREIVERHEEKMLQLGPVLERLDGEYLTPAWERALAVAIRAGLIPPPPPELRGQELRVEYQSIMAQAQKAVQASSITQLFGFAGGLATTAQRPDILDKLDFDEAIDQMADALGASPNLVVPDDKVAQLRAARAKAQQQAQAAQDAMAAAQGAQVLSKTDMAGDNALTRIAGPILAAQAGNPGTVQ